VLFSIRVSHASFGDTVAIRTWGHAQIDDSHCVDTERIGRKASGCDEFEEREDFSRTFLLEIAKKTMALLAELSLLSAKVPREKA
jgi:hypothetical protein